APATRSARLPSIRTRAAAKAAAHEGKSPMKGRNDGLSTMLWRQLKTALTENLGLKAICFSCALLLVAYERSQADEKARTIAFALNAQLPPEGSDRELMTPLPPSI